MRILGVPQSLPVFLPPTGSCDCHVHVFGQPADYPFSADRQYTPGEAPVSELAALQKLLGLDRAVMVQPSPYGTDNSCTLAAMQVFGNRARGVAVLARTISEATLEAMHEAGIRGARLNWETAGVTDPMAARDSLRMLAERIAPFGWHAQTYTSLAMVAALADTIAQLPTPLVIDHFGRARAALGAGQAGFSVLLELIRAGNVYVKLSAAYRISERADAADVDDIAQALVEAGPRRVVWGSDWPHTGGGRGAEARGAVEPFQPIDDGAALNRLAAWVPDVEQRRGILVDNPQTLYDFSPA